MVNKEVSKISIMSSIWTALYVILLTKAPNGLDALEVFFMIFVVFTGHFVLQFYSYFLFRNYGAIWIYNSLFALKIIFFLIQPLIIKYSSVIISLALIISIAIIDFHVMKKKIRQTSL